MPIDGLSDHNTLSSWTSFVIEREVAGAVSLSDGRSGRCPALSAGFECYGPQIQWLHSYVTRTKSIALPGAGWKTAFGSNARRAGIPADRGRQSAVSLTSRPGLTASSSSANIASLFPGSWRPLLPGILAFRITECFPAGANVRSNLDCRLSSGTLISLRTVPRGPRVSARVACPSSRARHASSRTRASRGDFPTSESSMASRNRCVQPGDFLVHSRCSQIFKTARSPTGPCYESGKGALIKLRR